VEAAADGSVVAYLGAQKLSAMRCCTRWAAGNVDDLNLPRRGSRPIRVDAFRGRQLVTKVPHIYAVETDRFPSLASVSMEQDALPRRRCQGNRTPSPGLGQARGPERSAGGRSGRTGSEEKARWPSGHQFSGFPIG